MLYDRNGGVETYLRHQEAGLFPLISTYTNLNRPFLSSDSPQSHSGGSFNLLFQSVDGKNYGSLVPGISQSYNFDAKNTIRLEAFLSPNSAQPFTHWLQESADLSQIKLIQRNFVPSHVYTNVALRSKSLGINGLFQATQDPISYVGSQFYTTFGEKGLAPYSWGASVHIPTPLDPDLGREIQSVIKDIQTGHGLKELDFDLYRGLVSFHYQSQFQNRRTWGQFLLAYTHRITNTAFASAGVLGHLSQTLAQKVFPTQLSYGVGLNFLLPKFAYAVPHNTWIRLNLDHNQKPTNNVTTLTSSFSIPLTHGIIFLSGGISVTKNLGRSGRYETPWRQQFHYSIGYSF